MNQEQDIEPTGGQAVNVNAVVRRFNINIPECVRCGASIGVLHRCHSCDYEQDGVYNDPVTAFLLAKTDYRLALLFFPHCMTGNFKLFREYASEIRGKLVTYQGRRGLQKLTEGRRDGWVFNAAV